MMDVYILFYVLIKFSNDPWNEIQSFSWRVASYNEKMQQALALKYEEELSNDLENQKVSQTVPQEVTEEQK